MFFIVIPLVLIALAAVIIALERATEEPPVVELEEVSIPAENWDWPA